MRISLLQRREPFAEILQRTLSGYWTQEFGQPFQVDWRPHRSSGQGAAQVWLCNAYLNSIFRPNLERAAWEPVRREFSRSRAAWRRPFQWLYVELASRPGPARLLAHATLSVTPQVPDGEQLLIIPGNRKIRLLDHRRRTSIGIQKAGFGNEGLRRELTARRRAEELGLRVPALQEVDLLAGWFREQYVSGTPLNRLSPSSLVPRARERAVANLHRLVDATQHSVPLESYLDQRFSQLCDLVGANSWHEPHIQQSVLERARGLHRMIEEGSGAEANVRLATTHGDFQPANILVNETGTWLIDWENSENRPTCYDLLVLASDSRSPAGLARRLTRLVQSDAVDTLPALRDWPGVNWETRRGRRRHAAMFLLEELTWHVRENANPLFLGESEGLRQLLAELQLWESQTANAK